MKKIKTEHVVFALYLVVLLWIILFKTALSLDDIRMMAGERSINFIPFYYDNETSILFHKKEIILNILVFVPFGVCLKMLGASFKKGIAIAILSSVALEAVQLIFVIGNADITDVITNTLGAVAGLFIYLIAAKIFKNEEKLKKVVNIIALVFLSIFIALMVLLIVANS